MSHNADMQLLRNSTIYSSHDSVASLIKHAITWCDYSGEALSVILFNCFNISAFLDSLPLAHVTANIEHNSGKVFVGTMSRSYGKKHKHHLTGKVSIAPMPHEGICLALTDGDRQFIDDVILHSIKKSFPNASRAFIYTRELNILLNTLAQNDTDKTIMVTKTSMKPRIISRQSRRQRETDLRWTDVPYADVFEEADHTDAWISSLSFQQLVTKTDQSGREKRYSILDGHVTRHGVFHVSGNFLAFYDTIISTASILLSKKHKLLSDRSRKKKEGYKGNPICIEFAQPILKEKAQIKRLASVIASMPQTSYSVIHGNPYLHMTVADGIDNSNYDVWVLSDRRITLTPQIVCSGAALNRLCEFISREFAEGEEKDLYEALES